MRVAKKEKNTGKIRPGIFALSVISLLLGTTLSGCGPTTRHVQFRINSQPEGAHVVFNKSGRITEDTQDWIYLGHTPLRGIRLLNEEKIEEAEKITLKVMHSGYYDQSREWDGQSFWDEAEDKGVIFWAPKLVPQPKAE